MNERFAVRFASALYGVAALAAAPEAPAQLSNPARSVTAQAPEYYELGMPLTLDQVLKKPDATRVLGPDGKITTAGDLRKAAAAAAKVKNPPRAVSGGTGKSVFGPGAGKAREFSAVLASVTSEAQASRTAAAILRASTPGIHYVNGKSTGFVLTPGAYLTVKGVEFGDTIGQLNLVGNFPGGALGVRVVEWKSGSVYALVPADVRGVLDQPATVQIVTAAGKTYRQDGGRFVAARAEITVTSGLLRYVRFQLDPSWGAELFPDGGVLRHSSGGHINCPSPGTDTITLLDLPKGFTVTEVDAVWGRTDTGDKDFSGEDGSRSYVPGYGFGDWSGNSLPIRWGVWRTHTSPDIGGQSLDMCESSYTLSLKVVGPAGVTPF